MINFKRGHPHPSLLPHAELTSTLLDLCHTSNTDSEAPSTVCLPGLDYGDPGGNAATRAVLAAFLSEAMRDDDSSLCPGQVSMPISPDRLFLTTGVSHGLDLLCSVLTQPGDVVWIERPTYYLAADIFRHHRLRLHPLPMHAGGRGIDVHRLVNDTDRPPPTLLYLIPSHHNPLGYVLDAEDRAKIARWAGERGVILVADEVYHLLDGDGEGTRPARMAAFDPNCCVSVSGLTKVCAPGIRTGWIEGSPCIMESLQAYGYLCSQGGCAPFGNAIVEHALQRGAIQRHWQHLRGAYRRRARLLHTALRPLETMADFSLPLGGYFMWVRFRHPAVQDTEQLRIWCEQKYDVTFLPGIDCDPFSKEQDKYELSVGCEIRSSFRLCFAYLDEEDITKGAQRLVAAIANFIKKEEQNDVNS